MRRVAGRNSHDRCLDERYLPTKVAPRPVRWHRPPDWKLPTPPRLPKSHVRVATPRVPWVVDLVPPTLRCQYLNGQGSRLLSQDSKRAPSMSSKFLPRAQLRAALVNLAGV